MELRGIEPLSGNKQPLASTCLDDIAIFNAASRNVQSCAARASKVRRRARHPADIAIEVVILPKSAYMASAEEAAPERVNLRSVGVSGAVIGVVCVYCNADSGYGMSNPTCSQGSPAPVEAKSTPFKKCENPLTR